jgi:formiminotetrahydrofolate cyclodeaminase
VVASDGSLSEWLAAVATPKAAAAGGAAAALSAAFAAALVEMVAGMTVNRERYAAVHERAVKIRARAAVLREELVGLARQDAEVFAGFERALALPRATEAERDARRKAKLAALHEGARVQLVVLERASETAELAAELAADGLATAIGDSAASGFIAAGVARSGYWAVRSNMQGADAGPADAGVTARGLELLDRAEAAEREIRRLLGERVG